MGSADSPEAKDRIELAKKYSAIEITLTLEQVGRPKQNLPYSFALLTEETRLTGKDLVFCEL